MLKQIQYFQAVVRCGSFTEAAEECFISQSAISQQIRAFGAQEPQIFINTCGRVFLYEKSCAFGRF